MNGFMVMCDPIIPVMTFFMNGGQYPQHLEFGKSDEEQVELEEDPMSSFDESLTPNVLQEDWRTPTEFFFMSF